MKRYYWMAIVSLGWASACLAVPENLALNKPYTLSPSPNYQDCMDLGDSTQLTDGIYSQGYFWTQLETVGWQRTLPVQCVIDLGQVEPICGASWSTAAGIAGVKWPENLFVLVSEDQASWTYLGDLCELGTVEQTPSENQYATFRFSTDQLQGRGRYVCVFAAATPYCFVDEIEVWRGPEAWLSGELPGQRTENLTLFYEASRVRAGVSARLRNDLQTIFTQAETLGYSGVFADAEMTKAALQNQIPAAVESIAEDFQTILPYGELHTQILALNAQVLRASGVTHPLVWQNNRWDPLTLSVIPPQGSATDSIVLDLMRGEVRGETFNITNPYDEDLDLKISVNGMSTGLHLELREVLVTDTLNRKPITAALRPLTPDAQGLSSLWVPAGCTRQVWLACNRPNVPAQTYAGTIQIVSLNTTFNKNLRLRVRIRNLDFPKHPTLHVGGWDDVDGQADAYVAPGNLTENLALMREMYVDSPWATKAVFPKDASFDTNGQLQNASALDFSVWDAWVDRWEGARNYCVFFSVGTSFNGEPMGTLRFTTMVGSWLTAWVRHIEGQGFNPEQMVILLVDEPDEVNPEKALKLVPWAQAIQAVNLGVRLFTDPTYERPWDADPNVFVTHDVLCPQTPMLLKQGEPFRTFYQNQKAAGKTLWLYSCDGPAKELDPVTYHRAQAWIAFQIGAKGSFFWAFGCGGGIGNSWRAYSQPSIEYSPYFVGPTSVMEGKHSEAIRESVQDYEYLCMLRAEAEKVRASGSGPTWLQRADDLLTHGVAEAVAIVNSSNMSWHVVKDRSTMDDVRVRVLDALSMAANEPFNVFSEETMLNTITFTRAMDEWDQNGDTRTYTKDLSEENKLDTRRIVNSMILMR